MNLLNIIRGFDIELYDYFEKELERQYYSLSFIPDENSITPLCSATLGNVYVNAQRTTAFSFSKSLEQMASERICQLFGCEHANVKSVTIEDASRVVLQALMQRGDVVMSLDLRKKEHCNSESLAYRFVNFGVDPKTQHLDLDAIEKQVKDNKPRLIILSPINYPQPIDYERFAKMASDVGAILWCDISQVAGLMTAKVMPSPMPYADIVTFTTHGALQGPRCSVILSKSKYASAIDRVSTSFGHSGLGSSELAALSVRLQEMQTQEYKDYCHAVIENASALAGGLVEGGMRLIGGGTSSHLVVVDSKHCGLSARGALEYLVDCGILVRQCQVPTADPEIKFDAVRFSSMPTTTRGITKDQIHRVGVAVGKYLAKPNEENEKYLHDVVREVATVLPAFHDKWLCDVVRQNLEQSNFFVGRSDSTAMADRSRLSRLVKTANRVIHHQ